VTSGNLKRCCVKTILITYDIIFAFPSFKICTDQLNSAVELSVATNDAITKKAEDQKIKINLPLKYFI
jgi:hypothetical protein